jgi:diacylglycerol kinase (ATP)
LKHFFLAFQYSFQGLRAAFRHEEAIRQELLFMVVLVPGAFILGENLLETAILLLVLLNVLALELLNSALETIIDKTVPEYNELAGRAKDMGSAAVFVALCIAGIVWSLIFWENIIS